MKKYIIDFFRYNYWANGKLLECIKNLPDKEESIKLFSHFITSQHKWLNRITKQVPDNSLTWFGPIFPLEALEIEWKKSSTQWIQFIESQTEDQLQQDVLFTRATDGQQLAVKTLDVILQLNYHSIHHRAQINRLMREQGVTPSATDYIFTALREA